VGVQKFQLISGLIEFMRELNTYGWDAAGYLRLSVDIRLKYRLTDHSKVQMLQNLFIWTNQRITIESQLTKWKTKSSRD